MEKKTILVVDDTPDNIDLLVGLLKEQYRIKAALNGATALNIAGTGSPPDLILLDVLMPQMDGFEVCRRLKKNPATESIPVLFLSAENGEEERKLACEHGAVGYLHKPVEPSALHTAIGTAMRV